jgi:hypothetical protein
VSARSLSPAAKAGLAVEIVRAYASVRRVHPKQQLPAVLERIRSTKPGAANGAVLSVDDARWLGGAVARTLETLPLDAKCLTQSLVLLKLLARRGVDARLVIAVKPGEEFGAHAWLEYGGAPILPPSTADFVRLVDL